VFECEHKVDYEIRFGFAGLNQYDEHLDGSTGPHMDKNSVGVSSVRVGYASSIDMHDA
jgi:hypothetical protein